jgi:Rab GTPase-activating protein 1
MQRVRELEINLAQAKVAQVEAECQNQNLQHLLTQQHQATAITNKLTPPNNSWKTKFIDSVVNSVQIPNMSSMNIPSFQSHINDLAGSIEPKQ